jgi:threonine/homoserine/homoserine lactone efflux protein
MLISFIIFALIAFLAGSLGKYIQQNNKISLFFKWMQIVVFVGIGIFILI